MTIRHQHALNAPHDSVMPPIRASHARDAFILRTAAMRPSDVAACYDESVQRARSARALRQYDGGRVVVLLADGAADAPSESWRAGLANAMIRLLADGIPVLRRTLHDWTPTTSPAAGQFYVVLDPTLHAFGTNGLASVHERSEDGDGVPAMVFIDWMLVRDE
jgi:hypothetical protein